LQDGKFPFDVPQGDSELKH